jgi:hypothetical protein
MVKLVTPATVASKEGVTLDTLDALGAKCFR